MESILLTGVELQLSSKLLIKNHQKTNVTDNLIRSLSSLNIESDREGILRCHGRLENAEIGNNAKYPIFILQKSFLAEVIIRDINQKGHPGINHTVSLVRQHFWIPQLRSQVTRLIRKCLQCQKFNNLPYRYPTQGNLPKERVIRSFQHVGLDYFGLIAITISNGQAKCYGAIITCMVTRLIHMDVVSDLTTTAFLNMLRRFFARRGVPRSITSDNAPTFDLGNTILQESIQAARNDPSIIRELSNREIDWKHITPYAPWQGGFYERLIKTVKLSLYKTLGGSKVSLEELSTIVIESEALLNTRPLTYIAKDFNNDQISRPIDFLQREVQLSYPLGYFSSDLQDPDYLPPPEAISVNTKKQAVMTLETSCQLTENFWQIWRTQYLTALREKRTLEVTHKKGCSRIPKEGTLVLIYDSLQPRHLWKLEMVDNIPLNSEGKIREVVVRLPAQRLIKRPVNLLVPLELEDTENYREENLNRSESEPKESQDDNSTDGEAAMEPDERPNKTYNLRPRQKINYNEGTENVEGTANTNNIVNASTLLQISVLLLLGMTATATINEPAIRSLQCIQGGVHLKSSGGIPYEICADEYCVQIDNPKVNENVSFPPHIVLHEHRVQWKFGEELNTIETVCPPSPFCQAITCTFCSANIFNPECWPTGAILVTATLLYFIITGCNVLLYVPLVVGKPIRIMMNVICHTQTSVSILPEHKKTPRFCTSWST
ncbi:hypothetical protein RB195_024579 [Necator americanus]|uniref:Integrase catalytic domain-containing protein n=1 Tax=Necator americanus TaxID=51031 RepID=A0ABR1ENX0_NECAM